MRLRFRDRNGDEQMIDGRSSLISALREGELTPDTPVFDDHEHRWMKASEVSGLCALHATLQSGLR